MEMATALFFNVEVTVLISWAVAGDHAHIRSIMSGEDEEMISPLFVCESDHAFVKGSARNRGRDRIIIFNSSRILIGRNVEMMTLCR